MQLNLAQFVEWLGNFIEVSTEYKDHLSANEVQVIWDHLMNVSNNEDDLDDMVDEISREAIEEMDGESQDDHFLQKFIEEMNRQAKDAARQSQPKVDPVVVGDRLPPYEQSQTGPWVNDIKPDIFLLNMGVN